MRVTAEATEEIMHLFVDHGVTGHAGLEIFQFGRCRQFAIKQEVANLEIMRIFRQLVDGIAAVQKLALVAINKGDLAFARRGGGKAWVMGEHARLAI